jgi:orotate phosphoribosyltransferase
MAVEDVMTTGGSIREVLELVRGLGGIPAAAGAIILRGADTASLGVPAAHLLELRIPTWNADECPLCKSGAGPAVKPGSRGNY